MSICVGCLVSAVTAGSVWALGKATEWQAERERRRAMDEVDRTTPCRGKACETVASFETLPAATEPT